MLVRHESPIVSVEENYNRLHYPPERAARDARYTRYLNDAVILRTQTSAIIPACSVGWRRAVPWRTYCSSAPGSSTGGTS